MSLSRPSLFVFSVADEITGKRGSGKGYALKCLLYHLRKEYSVVLLFSGTEAEDPAFTSVIPSCFVYDSFDAEALKTILLKQKERVTKVGKGVHSSMAIVFDDIWEQAQSISSDRSVQRLFFAGRVR